MNKLNKLKKKYHGMRLAEAAIGHINIRTGKVVFNELVNHPRIKKIMRQSGGQTTPSH